MSLVETMDCRICGWHWVIRRGDDPRRCPSCGGLLNPGKWDKAELDRIAENARRMALYPRLLALLAAAEDVLDTEWMGVTETYRPPEILIKSERLERLADAVKGVKP